MTWWRDHALLDSTDSNQASFKTENELSLKDLKRSDLHSILTCQASNNNISVPVSTSVKLDMSCKQESLFLPIFNIQSTLAIRNVLKRNLLVLRNHFPWPICHLLRMNKEHLALRNSVTKKFLIAKFYCIFKAKNIYFLSVVPSYDCTEKNPIFCLSFH